jgi:arylformamidase
MPRVIELSHGIAENMSVYPGDPPIEIITHTTYEESGYHVSKITLGTHTGTHVDAPYHRLPDGKTIDAIPLSNFFGKALIIDLTFLNKKEEVLISHLEKHAVDIQRCRIIILQTNWSDHYGKGDYFQDYPGIGEEAALWLTRQDINLLGLETPSVHTTLDEKIHEILLSNDIIIVENLSNIKEIRNKFVQFFAIPLYLKGLDGSPVRGFAIDEG